jgi:anti-sigma B factor antagonist
VDGAERLTITRPEDDASTVEVAGELDAYSAPALEAVLAEHDASSDLRLDLSGVTFIDSTGIRAVVTTDNRLREGEHRLIVVDPSPSVLRLLQLTSLDERFLIEAAQ